MLDPQPTFGRFTASHYKPQPRDQYEWICEAEDALASGRRLTTTHSEKLDLLNRAIEWIEHAKVDE